MKLEYISESGDILSLTNNNMFKLSNVDGLTTASVELSSSTVSGMDGDVITNRRTFPRSIIFDLSIETADVETVKTCVFQYIKPKKTATLQMTTGERVLQISGVVESINMPRFTNSVIIQITLYCSNPYWQDADYVTEDISSVIDLHYFTDYEDDMLYFEEEGIPFGEYDANLTKIIVNNGDVDVGMEIHVIALDTVTNPVIYNSSGEYIGANVTMEANDEIVISTVKGKKSITLNGESIFPKLKQGSTWLQLKTGEDEYTIDSDEGERNVYFSLIYKRAFV